MSENFAGWLPAEDGADGAEQAPAGFGGPAWLPASVQRAQYLEDVAERRADRAAERERQARAEDSAQRALSLAAKQAQLRGEVVDVLALATGQLPGRTAADVLGDALAASARDDARDSLRLQREGAGQPVHVEVGEPNIIAPAVRSETGRRIFNRARRFRAVLEARKALEQAEKAAIASRDDAGYVCDAPTRRDPLNVVTADARRAVSDDGGLRIRYGGPITGIR